MPCCNFLTKLLKLGGAATLIFMDINRFTQRQSLQICSSWWQCCSTGLRGVRMLERKCKLSWELQTHSLANLLWKIHDSQKASFLRSNGVGWGVCRCQRWGSSSGINSYDPNSPGTLRCAVASGGKVLLCEAGNGASGQPRLSYGICPFL